MPHNDTCHSHRGMRPQTKEDNAKRPPKERLEPKPQPSKDTADAVIEEVFGDNEQ